MNTGMERGWHPAFKGQRGEGLLWVVLWLGKRVQGSKGQLELQERTLNDNSLALIIEYQMVVDHKHLGQKGDIVTNTRIGIRGERGHHRLLCPQPYKAP